MAAKKVVKDQEMVNENQVLENGAENNAPEAIGPAVAEKKSIMDKINDKRMAYYQKQIEKLEAKESEDQTEESADKKINWKKVGLTVAGVAGAGLLIGKAVVTAMAGHGDGDTVDVEYEDVTEDSTTADVESEE